MVKCEQREVDGVHWVELIFFSQGEQLLFDKVGNQIWQRDFNKRIQAQWGWEAHAKTKLSTIFKGSIFKQKDDRTSLKPNSVVVRVV